MKSRKKTSEKFGEVTENTEICGMTKSEEREFEMLKARVHEAELAKRSALQKARQAEDKLGRLEQEVSEFRRQQTEGINNMQQMMQQMMQFVMGNGSVSLSDTIVNPMIAAIRKEFEAREQKLIAAYEQKLSAKENEIKRLQSRRTNKAGSRGSEDGNQEQGGQSPESRIRQLEQQNSNLAGTAYGQHTESEKYHHGIPQTENQDELDLNGEDVPDEQIVKVALRVKELRSRKGEKCPRRQQPLFSELDDVDPIQEESMPEDERRVIVLRPEGLPSDAEEIGRDVANRLIWVDGYFRTCRIVRLKYKDPRGRFYEAELPERYRNCLGRMEITESVLAEILTRHFYYGETLGEIEHWLRRQGLNYSHSTIMGWIEKASDILSPLDEPLQSVIIRSGNQHSDETTLKCCDQRLPGRQEKESDVEEEQHYFKRWIFCHYSPSVKLTQFGFYKRGRRTQEAITSYLKDVREKLWVHSDGAQLYKCYDRGELIYRVACLVHMRRPFYKLKDSSDEASRIVKICDEIFHRDKLIKQAYTSVEEISKERIIQIGPLLNEFKQMLTSLSESLNKEDDPELLKAVNYALKEYPCLLHCLKDGSLDFSNNVCERQIRKIAKYRNNSFFVGSPESGVRYARLMSVFANIRNHNLAPMTYLCDVFRRIGKTAKEDLETLLAHLWTPQAVLNL